MTGEGARRLGLSAVTLVLACSLAGCGGGDDAPPKGASAEQVLAQAKKTFDNAASVHLKLATASKPTSGDAVLGADGTLTHQPAFKGNVRVLLSGFNAEVPVIAVDGKVYARLPLTPSYTPINPAEYSAPDPADFADADKGISGLLLKMKDVADQGKERHGKQLITLYSGTLDGAYVAPIIPSASTGGSYRAVVGINQDHQILTLKVTGEFFSGGGDETYDLTFDAYDKNVKITAP